MNTFLFILNKQKFKTKHFWNAMTDLRQDKYAELAEGIVLTITDDPFILAVAKRVKGLKDDQYFALNLDDEDQCFGSHPTKEQLQSLWNTYHHELVEKIRESLLQSEAFSGYSTWIGQKDRERARLRKNVEHL